MNLKRKSVCLTWTDSSPGRSETAQHDVCRSRSDGDFSPETEENLSVCRFIHSEHGLLGFSVQPQTAALSVWINKLHTSIQHLVNVFGSAFFLQTEPSQWNESSLQDQREEQKLYLCKNSLH